MVYYGAPSRGCEACRTRKVKCDEAHPTCHRCLALRRQCVYRDGTKSPESKQNHQHSSKSLPKKDGGKRFVNGPESWTSRWTTPHKVQTSSTSQILTTTQLDLPLEDIACCHFIANYVLIPQQFIATARGFLEFVPPLCKLRRQMAHFDCAFDACALASLNNRVSTGNEFEARAMQKYTQALAATSKALNDPHMATQDATLGAVLLLGLFETITAKGVGLVAWSSHVEGAIQIVKQRGPKQFESKIGVDLFIAVRTQMIIHSISTGKSLPDFGIHWWIDDPSTKDYASACLQLGIRTGRLRTKINDTLPTLSKTSSNRDAVDELIKDCRKIEEESILWSKSLPQNFNYKAVAWQNYIPPANLWTAEAFPGRVDGYQDIWVANLWNVLRCCRIVLMSLITRLHAWLRWPADYRTMKEYAIISKTCVGLIEDIIASVPYQMGWLTKQQNSTLNHAAATCGSGISCFGCGDDSADKGLSGYFLLWPLTCIFGLDYLTNLQRVWVKGRLVSIGNQLGVRHGNVLSKLNVRTPSMLILKDNMTKGTASGTKWKGGNDLDSVAIAYGAGIYPNMDAKNELK